MKTHLLFETELTDGSRFRKLEPIYIVSIILFYAISLVYSIYNDGNKSDPSDGLFIPYVVICTVLFVLVIVLYIKLRRRVVKGNIKIYSDKIDIEKGEITTYKLNEIENFEIQRGSTYHYDHEVGNELVHVGNYVRFKSKGEFLEHEFLIDSKKKNKAFESMIHELQRNRIKLFYTSI